MVMMPANQRVVVHALPDAVSFERHAVLLRLQSLYYEDGLLARISSQACKSRRQSRLAELDRKILPYRLLPIRFWEIRPINLWASQEKRTAGFPAALPRPSRLESGGGTARPDLPSGQVPRIDFRYRKAAAAPRVAREVHPPRKPALFLPTADRLAGDVELPANLRNGVVPIHPMSSSMRLTPGCQRLS